MVEDTPEPPIGLRIHSQTDSGVVRFELSKAVQFFELPSGDACLLSRAILDQMREQYEEGLLSPQYAARYFVEVLEAVDRLIGALQYSQHSGGKDGS